MLVYKKYILSILIVFILLVTVFATIKYQEQSSGLEILNTEVEQTVSATFTPTPEPTIDIVSTRNNRAEPIEILPLQTVVIIDEDKLFDLVNKERALNGVNPFKRDEDTCRISKDRTTQILELGRLPNQEEGSKVIGPSTFRHLYSLSSIMAPSEEESLKLFKEEDQRSGINVFTGGQFVWGCVSVDQFATTLTVGY